MLNKQKGNMYPFVTHTWNPISGKCIHDCSYCYMKIWPQKELHLNEKALKDNLGKGRFIFVGSSTDMFAENVPRTWIEKALHLCRIFPNKYLFQTKNPQGIAGHNFPLFDTTFAVTVESDINHAVSDAPTVGERICWLLSNRDVLFAPLMISIEPVMDFDMEFVDILKSLRPTKISIGADSQGHHLPEPEPQKLREFLEALKGITQDIVIKDNLKRLLKNG